MEAMKEENSASSRAHLTLDSEVALSALIKYCNQELELDYGRCRSSLMSILASTLSSAMKSAYSPDSSLPLAATEFSPTRFPSFHSTFSSDEKSFITAAALVIWIRELSLFSAGMGEACVRCKPSFTTSPLRKAVVDLLRICLNLVDVLAGPKKAVNIQVSVKEAPKMIESMLLSVPAALGNLMKAVASSRMYQLVSKPSNIATLEKDLTEEEEQDQVSGLYISLRFSL